MKKWEHPEVLHTGHKDFKIVQKSLTKDSLYGCVEFPKATITVDPNQSEVDYKGTLLHEIIHVGWDLWGLGDDDEMPQMGNEFITTVTSNMLQVLWGQNQELFTFIFSSDE
mgnify:FL=1|tara:strand:+ start:1866 stop:2198 length:333 start_codon:yes stop_codon:yes gene_type:complete